MKKTSKLLVKRFYKLGNGEALEIERALVREIQRQDSCAFLMAFRGIGNERLDCLAQYIKIRYELELSLGVAS